jgi:ABC-2 type transport system permease protein
MRGYLTLMRRELGSYFLSMTGYIVIAAAMFLLGWSFCDMLVNLRNEPTSVPVVELFYNTLLFWLILIVTPPVITMRLFAHEKFSGTFETLMTTPVSELQVVLAKFSAGMIFFMLVWSPLLACLWVVQHFTNNTAGLEPSTVGSAFLGILLLGSVIVSQGCCASALTRSQVIAAVMNLGFGASIFFLGVMASQAPLRTTWQAQALNAVAFFEQMHDFARGVVDTRPVVLYVTTTSFFLFLTLRIVESRRWK